VKPFAAFTIQRFNKSRVCCLILDAQKRFGVTDTMRRIELEGVGT
jgi:hypothetical protein